MKKSLLLVASLLLVFIVTGCSKDEFINSGTISCTQYESVLTYNGVIIIDVRNKDEYDSGHIENAINIPYEEIEEKIKDVDNINLDSPIIVYCKSGVRSSKAYESLKKLQYKHIYNLGAMNKCTK